jgi:hypothetical protein
LFEAVSPTMLTVSVMVVILKKNDRMLWMVTILRASSQ